MSSDVSKSWFAVFNNPEHHGYAGIPEDICNRLRDEWIQDSTTRTGAWAYCVSAEGLRHVHMVLEDITSMRFSAIKKSYPSIHLEPTKGTKQQAEDYIYKRHPYDEKGETIVCVVKAGEIHGNSGHRSDLERIAEMLDDGKTPDEIMADNFAFTRYSKQIREDYFRRRRAETPPIRDVECHYIVGDAGSGKTYTYVDLCSEHGENNVFLVSDYKVGGMDL